MPESLLADAGVDRRAAPGALHAAEHAGIGVLPLFTICDRWDVGGVSTLHQPDIGGPAIVIYDGYQGGAGVAELGYEAAERHVRATADGHRGVPVRATAARRACSRPSAATATTRSTRRGRSPCSTRSGPDGWREPPATARRDHRSTRIVASAASVTSPSAWPTSGRRVGTR